MGTEKLGLLVLGRALGEKLMLQHPALDFDIEIKISELSYNRVKLAISAPQDVNIVRAEILKRDGIFVRRYKKGGRDNEN